MPSESRPPPLWLWAIWGTSLLLTLGLAFDLSPWLRGDLDWRWGYFPDVSFRRLALAGAGLAVYIGLAAGLWVWAQRLSGSRRAWLAVGFAALASIPIQIGMNAVPDPNPWREIMLRTTSPFVGGYYDVAVQVDDVGQFLRDFPNLAVDFLPHPQRRPPGIILYFIGLERLFDRAPGLAARVATLFDLQRCEAWPLLYVSDAKFAAASGGLLNMLLNPLALVPLFAVGRQLLGGRTALAAVLASPLVPAYILWAGMWDQGLVLVTALLLWLLHHGLARGRIWALPAAGLLLSAATFFTWAMLVLVGFAAIYGVFTVWSEREYWWSHAWRLALGGSGFLGGLAAVWFGYWLASGASVLEVYRATTEAHFAMSSRYLSRLIYNPYGFALFLGFAPATLGLVCGWQVLRARAGGQALSGAHRLAAATLLTIAALTLSGASRAEVGRVWLFLMPLVVLAAFSVPGGPEHSTGRWAMTAGVVAAQALVMQAFIFGGRKIPHNYALPSTAEPVGARVGDNIWLEGYETDRDELEAGDTLTATLYWRALVRPSASYVVFTHLYSPGLGAAALQDSPPKGGQYPTTCWQPGEVVFDRVAMQTDSRAAPGVYELIVGMYNPALDNERLPTDGPGARDRAIVLTQIRVAAPDP